jgi:Ca2+-binding EF-hand superfamily protein
MIGGISGLDSLYNLQQLRQSQSGSISDAQLFSKIDANGDGSISKDEFSTFQSNMATQFKNSIMGSQTDSTSALLALLQSAGLAASGSSALSTAASDSTPSLKNSTTADQLFSKIDTNGDKSISKDEFAKAGLTIHHHQRRNAYKAGSQNGSPSHLDQLFTKIDTNGDGSISQDEITTFITNLGSIINSNTANRNKLTTTV